MKVPKVERPSLCTTPDHAIYVCWRSHVNPRFYLGFSLSYRGIDRLTLLRTIGPRSWEGYVKFSLCSIAAIPFLDFMAVLLCMYALNRTRPSRPLTIALPQYLFFSTKYRRLLSQPGLDSQSVKQEMGTDNRSTLFLPLTLSTSFYAVYDLLLLIRFSLTSSFPQKGG